MFLGKKPHWGEILVAMGKVLKHLHTIKNFNEPQPMVKKGINASR
jgi:hypothetical protein